MNYSSLALLALAIVLLKLFQKVLGSKQRRHLPLPPGPSPVPLIGNFRDLPTKDPWSTYAEWGIKYHSDVVHASALGQHIVVVNSIKAAIELFEKRAHIYSGRPALTMVELMEWDSMLAFMPPADRWREHRTIFQQYFRRDISLNYRPTLMRKTHQLLRALLSSPQQFREHLKTLAAATIMATVYGYDQLSNDHFVALADNATTKLAESVFPGAVAVNTFPILKYLPSWMPGAGFQRFAAEARELTREMREVPFDFVKQNMRDGVDSSSLVAKLLEENQAGGRHDEATIKDVAATAYAGGSDTIVHCFIFPCYGCAPRNSKESTNRDRHRHRIHRLPEFEDHPSLPFIEALYREVMRWKPATPLGMAHASTPDDTYGATVISNIWAMTHDKSIYPEPERFNPERYFTADGKLNDDDTVLTFGFGRRLCIGRHTADASIRITIVSVLSTFSIAKAKDATGKEIDIVLDYSDGLVSHPEPFACSIIPRSEIAKALVQATMETADS